MGANPNPNPFPPLIPLFVPLIHTLVALPVHPVNLAHEGVFCHIAHVRRLHVHMRIALLVEAEFSANTFLCNHSSCK